jgi:hypothetical protein
MYLSISLINWSTLSCGRFLISDILNIKTVYDMEDYLKKNKINSHQWFSEEIDMDGIIDRYGGEEPFMRQILTWSFDGSSKNDQLGIQNGFVYYRTGYVVGK